MRILQKAIIIFFMFGLIGCAGRDRLKVQQDTVDLSTNIEDVKDVTELEINLSQLTKNSQEVPIAITNRYLVDENNVIELSIARKGYTRFSIEKERITDVFIYPQEAVQARIHDQGYMIIVPDAEFNTGSDKIYVTITGEEGTTQDLSLHFIGRAPMPVRFYKLPTEQNLEKLGE